MTAICPGGGPSEVIPTGPQVSVSLTGEVLSAALGFVAGKLAGVLSAAIGVVNISLTAICATDPPPYPSTTDLTNALAGLFGTSAEVATLVELATQWVIANQWDNYCQCVTGPQPTPATPPADPTVLPTVPPTGPGAGTPCQIIPTVGFVITGTTLNLIDTVTLPQNATSLIVQCFEDAVTNTGAKPEFSVAFYTPAGATLIAQSNFNSWVPTTPSGNHRFYSNGGTTGVQDDNYTEALVNGVFPSGPQLTIPVPAGAAQVQVHFINAGTAASIDCWFQGAIYCGGETPDSTGCCPTPPDVTLALGQIIQLLQQLLGSQPTLGVRSYATGPAHTGLTGYGAVTFTDDAIGVKVNITTVGPAVGQQVGDPTFYFGAGYINLVTEQGTLAGVRLEYDGQFIPFPVLVVSLTYTLGPSVVVTITEVTAGP